MTPIETRYKGYRFRSRLEARWAVYFDALGLEWEYEREGFDFDGLKYLPDFWLPQVRMWAEVKPEAFTIEEIVKANFLAKHTGKPCLMLIGTPAAKPYQYVQWSEEMQLYEHYFCAISMLKDYPITEQRFYSNFAGVWPEDSFGSEDDLFGDIPAAVAAARSARFEFGECG